jgi:DNA-binding transcriptional ArsR family regulator
MRVRPLPFAFTVQARTIRALGHPARLAIVRLLGREEACVCHLAAALRLPQSKVSQHLMALRRARVVRARREGKNVFYHLGEPDLPVLLDGLTGADQTAGFGVNLTSAADCPCPRCRKST